MVEECASFATGFGKTLLFENNRCSLLVNVMVYIQIWVLHTFCCKARICGVGIFRSCFSDLQLFLLEILLPLILVLVGLRHG